MPDAAKPRLLIVDGHAYAYRAFHAIRELNGPDGAPTNAIYGFIKMLTKMEASVQPTHHAVAWDGGLSATRMAALPEYKEGRPTMPTGLERQLPEIMAYLKAAGVPSFQHEGVEADDWIASRAMLAVGAGAEVVIASADKDFMQLVSANVALLNPNEKSGQVWGEEQVRGKTGVAPGQMVDWLSLVGDAVDNIAGVPGVGPKTAADLLNLFGSVNGIYAHLAEVKSDRIRESLKASEAIVRRNQDLIRLHTEVPGQFDFEALAVGAQDAVQLLALFRRWGFKGMAAQVEAAATQGDFL